MYYQSIQLGGQIDLARKAARPSGTAGEIEHVFFVAAGRGQFVEPVFANNHMTGGTGHLPFAGAFQRLPRVLRDFEQTIARFGLHCLRGFAIRADEMDFQANCLSAAALINSDARSISSSVV